MQVWSEPGGDVRPDGVQGVYCYDDRVLDTVLLDTPGHTLEALQSRTVAADHVVFTSVPRVQGETADPLVLLTRTRRVSREGTREFIALSNASSAVQRLALRVRTRLDATPMERIKDDHALEPPTPDVAADADGTLRWRWRSPKTRASLQFPGARVERRGRDVEAVWDLAIEPNAEADVQWSLAVSDMSAPFDAPQGPRPLARLAHPIGRDTSDHRVHHLLQRALSDADALLLCERETPDDLFLAAGAPWFFTLFGRDSLIAADFLADVAPKLGIGTLRILGRRQGIADNTSTGEQPGKILHEVRRAGMQLGNNGETLQLPPVYFGTIDATALWVRLFLHLWRDPRNRAEMRGLLPSLRSCVDWLMGHGDADGDGFLEYYDQSGHGLANQGWKDSGDSIRFADGRIANGPIALCEAQAYCYQALAGAADVLEPLGDDVHAWRDRAADLKLRFHQQFWVDNPHGHYLAMALDHDKRPVDGTASNMGHALGTGILYPGEAEEVVTRLMAPDMFNGHGIRTLSSLNGGYWPLRYHCGAVWTHDNAVIIQGMRAEGFPGQARRVALGLLDAAERFDYRLPELFGGNDCARDVTPLPYPAACRPQSWAAASAVVIALALRG